MADGYLKMKPTKQLLRERGLQNNASVQKYIDSEVLRLCNPKVPFRSGDLARSGVINTKIGSGEVRYSTPYARRMYYHPEYSFTGAPERGAYWFERMKKNGGKEEILKGAAKIAGGSAE